MLAAHAAIAPLNWHVFVETPLSEAFAPLYTNLLWNAGLLLLGLAIAVLASLFLARNLVGPIRALQEGAARIGRGDLRAASTSGPATSCSRSPSTSIRWPVSSRNPTRTSKARSRSGPASWRAR